MEFNSTIDFKEKYLKYKQKYIDLKNKLYGGDLTEKQKKIFTNLIEIITGVKTDKKKDMMVLLNESFFDKFKLAKKDDKFKILEGISKSTYLQSTSENENTPLHIAVEKKLPLVIIQKLITKPDNKGYSILDKTNGDCLTPLQIAIKNKLPLEYIKSLISKNNLYRIKGVMCNQNPLYYIVENTELKDLDKEEEKKYILDLIKNLVSKDEKDNRDEEDLENIDTPLHLAIHRELFSKEFLTELITEKNLKSLNEEKKRPIDILMKIRKDNIDSAVKNNALEKPAYLSWLKSNDDIVAWLKSFYTKYKIDV